MIKKLVHFSDLHIKLFKDHEHYKNILNDCLNQWKDISPDRIVFTGDLVHSKNQMTPELIDMVTWVLTECSKIAKTLVLIGNHDFLENNMERMDALTPIINMMNNDNVVYLKEGGVLEDDNIMWVIYSLTDHNKKPNIPQSDKMKIGLFHGPIQGATTDMGFAFDDGYEARKVCDNFDLSYHCGTAVTYILRAYKKHETPVDCIKKAIAHLQFELEKHK
jgi:hypothetical protein